MVSKVHPPAAFYPFQLHALPPASSSFPPFFTFSSYPTSNHLASTMPCIPQNYPVGHCRHGDKKSTEKQGEEQLERKSSWFRESSQKNSTRELQEVCRHSKVEVLKLDTSELFNGNKNYAFHSQNPFLHGLCSCDWKKRLYQLLWMCCSL